MRGEARTKHRNVSDLTQASYTVFGTGVKKRNPRKCLTCHQPIKRGETWCADTSVADPRFGRYTVIRHSPRCPDRAQG